MIHIIELKELFVEAREIRQLTIYSFLIVLFFDLIFAFWLGNTINRPLKKLVPMTSPKVRMTSNASYVFDPDDKVGQIGYRFIRMLNENDELNAKMIGSMLKQKEAEVRALQAQINPHFLYNTLESLNTSITANSLYWLEVVAVGSSIKVYFNNASTPNINVTDATWTLGAIGLRTYQASAKFDNITVTPN